MSRNEIRIRVGYGHLIGGRNDNLYYGDVYIMYETANGDIIDVAVIN